MVRLTVASRLVREIRKGDTIGSGALSKVWDFDMRDGEAEFRDDLREASGVGRRKGRRVCIALSVAVTIPSQHV